METEVSQNGACGRFEPADCSSMISATALPAASKHLVQESREDQRETYNQALTCTMTGYSPVTTFTMSSDLPALQCVGHLLPEVEKPRCQSQEHFPVTTFTMSPDLYALQYVGHFPPGVEKQECRPQGHFPVRTFTMFLRITSSVTSRLDDQLDGQVGDELDESLGQCPRST